MEEMLKGINMGLLDLTWLATAKTKIISALVVFFATIAIVGGFTYWGYKLGYAASKVDQLEATVTKLEDHAKELATQQAEFNDSVTALNTSLTENNKTVKIITTNTEREIEKPVYHTTVVPASGMQLLADNATELNAKRIPNGSIGAMSGNSDSK